MSKQVEMMIRELSDKELDVVSGAKGMEADASRYTEADWGPFRYSIDNKTGDWAMTFNGPCCGYGTTFLSIGRGVEVVNH
jgi:hypothetical protein